MKTIAVLGAGYIGHVHAEAIQKSDAVKLVAFLQKDGEKAKAATEKFNVPCFSDAEEMLSRTNPDILDICLPTSLHEEYVLFAAKHKKHVLCEKPFSLSSGACLRMVKACADAGVHLMIAQVLRWFPEFVKIKELIPALGPIHAVSCNRLAQHPNWTTWHRVPEISGGGLFDLIIHDIDFLFYLFGEVDHVYAAGWKSPTGCWNHVLATLSFKNGVKAQAEGSNEMTGNYPFSSMFRVVGDKGTLEHRLSAGFNIENLEEADNKIILFGVNRDPVDVVWEPGEGFQPQIEDFAKSAETGKPVTIPLEDSVYLIKIMEALQRSMETGKTQTIG